MTNKNIITLKFPHKTDISILKPFMTEQTKTYHIAYKLFSKGLSEKEIRNELKNRNINAEYCDSWLIQSAIKKAKGQYESDVVLDKQKGTNIAGKRIFGGKKNFIRRLKGLISKEEYREKRIENFRSIGEADKYGNRKVDFNLNSIVIKPNRKTKLEIALPCLHGKYAKYYCYLLEQTELKNIPVTVEISKEYVYLSFDISEIEIKKKKIIKGRYAGIDLNPNYIGVSFFNENKRLIDTRLYNFTQLTGKKYNADKLKHEIREVAIQIGKIANHYQIEYVFIEDLSFKQGNKKKGKNYNRLTINQFLYNEFERMLSKYCKIIKVNPVYSSVIGNIMYDDYPDPLASSIEIARRGIESRIIKGSNKFYPPIVDKEVLRNRWKEEVIPDLSTWKELSAWLKQTGLRYRVPIPEIGMFRLFNSCKQAKVLVL